MSLRWGSVVFLFQDSRNWTPGAATLEASSLRLVLVSFLASHCPSLPEGNDILGRGSWGDD